MDDLSDAGLFVDSIRRAENSPPGAVSPKGATSVMQVMPATAANPGFGIAPASGPDDVARVGEDVARAMFARYGGNQVLASAAYNAGPGRVDQWIKQFGDPRTGVISNEDWRARIPFDETRKYTGGFVGLGQSPGVVAPGLTLAPSGNLLTPSAPEVEKLVQAKLGAGLSQGSGAGGPDPRVAMQLLNLLVPKTHTLQPVYYDPWAVQKKGTGQNG